MYIIHNIWFDFLEWNGVARGLAEWVKQEKDYPFYWKLYEATFDAGRWSFVLGGRQFKVTANDLIVINRIEADIGEQIFLEKVGAS